ncbi:methanol O-anthraniloyltransferase-like [Mangifera indica]|uniref:methanol O-anthraniloyltransferase-like n=1 Tax=Mangifera indica TaxID=29780 RepID=UPI001CFC0CB7|nr:methanol O-anthraniloyltransferase-like [Mangifera indica]
MQTPLKLKLLINSTMASKIFQSFSVTRQAPELIVPAEPTPQEVKELADIDDQQGYRFQIPLIFVYRNNHSPKTEVRDPVKVIREALSKALVFYYPLAGRLREGDNRKLMVDCNGQGVLFIEADANFSLDQLDNEIHPPFSRLDELLYNVPGSDGILGCPLMLIQVTRLLCGGFFFALRLNHTMADAYGIVQFLNAMEEMAQGKLTPSITPVWQRHILSARNPPRITHIHHEYEQLDNSNDTLNTTDPNDLDHKSFFFGSEEISSLRNHLPPHLKNSSTFEIIIASLWKCRTAALQLNPNQTVRFSCIATIRGKSNGVQLPKGYYGNAFGLPAVSAKAGSLCGSGLGYAVELVKRAKAEMSGEYLKSVADLMVLKGRPRYTNVENFIVSNVTKSGLAKIDFGWGKPVFGGAAGAVSLISFFMEIKRRDGKNGVLIPICLPKWNMVRFEGELKKMIAQGASLVCKL